MSTSTLEILLASNHHRPGPEASILLSAYEFTSANGLFTTTLLSITPSTKGQQTPLSSFLSYTSYLLHHAHRSTRCTLYGTLALTVLRLIFEDVSHAKLLSNPPIPLSVRIARQVPPFLPPGPDVRSAISTILDICIDSITHNLRLRLDCSLYISTLNLLHRILAHMNSMRTRLIYHWSLLWQTLLSLLRFLTTYASSLISMNPPETLHQLLTPFLSSLALAVAEGETLLPDWDSYDDLFYKLVEAGELLPRFKAAFFPPSTTNSATATAGSKPLGLEALDTLIHVSKHYHALLEAEKQTGKVGKNLEMREVGRVIRKGFESLEMPPGMAEGRFAAWERWREGEERGFLKRCARAAVEDGRRVVGGR